MIKLYVEYIKTTFFNKVERTTRERKLEDERQHNDRVMKTINKIIRSQKQLKGEA